MQTPIADEAGTGPVQNIETSPVREFPPLLDLRHVSVDFERPMTARSALEWARGHAATPRPSPVRAVDDVSITIGEGEIVGLVGESGCGKSTLGRVAVGLQRATRGARLLRGEHLDSLGHREARARQLQLQMVFQDPYASLNPRLRVLDLIGEAPVTHGIVAKADQRGYVAELLERVGLQPGMATRFPHEFSGGQRARIGIARALAVNPAFIVCDEAVAALDVSVQSQVLNLFTSLRDRLGLSYLFVSHNLAVVNHMADRVAVMYLGRLIESAPARSLFRAPAHPYTQALLAEAPTLKAQKRKFIPIRGEMPSPLSPPSGCHFHPRCPHAMPRCSQEIPRLRSIAAGHATACHLYSD